MLAIIEKVKDLFKCKCEKKEESAPQQEDPKAKQCTEEHPTSSEETGSD